MNPAPASPPTPPSPLARINLALLAALAAAFSLLLWPQWRHNPELSHGLFMPLIFLRLLRESRSAGPARFLPARGATLVALAGLLAARSDRARGWRPLHRRARLVARAEWSFTLAFALVLILLAALLVFASEPVRLVPFNWISFMAISLWLLCAPIPPGTYMRLTLGLQLWVTRSVLTTLHLFGVAAIRNGNLIEAGRATVGVEEACSGVRSLISCVFAGFFFSAALVRRPWSRVVVIALAAPLALAMNFFRSLALTLLADRGVDISHTWHNATGYAILGLTALLLGGLALLLARGEKTDSPPSRAPAAHTPRALQPWLAAGLALAVALVVLFVFNTRRAPPAGARAGSRSDRASPRRRMESANDHRSLSFRRHPANRSPDSARLFQARARWQLAASDHLHRLLVRGPGARQPCGFPHTRRVLAGRRMAARANRRYPGQPHGCRPRIAGRGISDFSQRRLSPARLVLASLRRISLIAYENPHRHVNFCGWPGTTVSATKARNFLSASRAMANGPPSRTTLFCATCSPI